MKTNGLVKDVGMSLAAAYAAVRIMDRTTKWFLDRQSKETTARERAVQPEFTTTVAAKKLAGAGNVELADDDAKELGKRLHRVVGLSGGPLAVLMSRRGTSPITAGVATGLGMWALLDEGLNPVLGLSKPAPEYPFATHARGFVGHAVYGAALGGLLALSRTLPPFRARAEAPALASNGSAGA